MLEIQQEKQNERWDKMIYLKIIFWIAVFIIFWANLGYYISMIILDKIFKPKNNEKNYNYNPTVTLMIVAHNEEKVIKKKLENATMLDYPREKLEILISSDNSDDNTNSIVEMFIKENYEYDIKLYKVKTRKGKTNAQNEAAKIAKGEVLVMTDANSMLKLDAIREIVASFSSKEIAYVTGNLYYCNSSDNETSKSESTYWNLDLKIRDIESRFQTVTAGNGALYACRTKEYVDFNPIKCHDSSMPLYYALEGRRAIFNHDAIAYEKAGENNKDEFKRKVRMNRIILSAILPSLKILNIFKYKWFTYFYLGHRTCRYLLWIMHIIALILNMILLTSDWIYVLTFVGQTILYMMAVIKMITKINNKYLNIIYYYCMTVVAQIIGVKNILTGKAKPFWEKAESTR